MKMLSAFVTCNFPHYARNAIESFRAFYPEFDCLVVDNGSDNPDLIRYLRDLDAEPGPVKVIFRGENERGTESKSGSLYQANNLIIEYALDHAYDFILFNQDDFQFMWRDETLQDRLARIFADAPNIGGLLPMFAKKGIPANHQVGCDWESLGVYGVPNYGIAAFGFASTAFLKRTGFRFSRREGDYGGATFRAGYRAYHMRDPICAFVPWVATRRNGRIIGRERPPRERFYLRPLDTEQIVRLRNRPYRELAFTEDFCFPWGYRCLAPYWFTTPSWEYFKQAIAEHRRRGLPPFWPRFVDEGGRVEGLFNGLSSLISDHEPHLTEILPALLREPEYKLRHKLKLRTRLRRLMGRIPGVSREESP